MLLQLQDCFILLRRKLLNKGDFKQELFNKFLFRSSCALQVNLINFTKWFNFEEMDRQASVNSGLFYAAACLCLLCLDMILLFEIVVGFLPNEYSLCPISAQFLTLTRALVTSWPSFYYHIDHHATIRIMSRYINANYVLKWQP